MITNTPTTVLIKAIAFILATVFVDWGTVGDVIMFLMIFGVMFVVCAALLEIGYSRFVWKK